MATYVMLAQFTQQGIANIKNTAKRAEDFRLMASAHGVTVKEIFWTLGQYRRTRGTRYRWRRCP